MFMDKGLDTGDMILKSETKIGKNETSGELFDRLSIMGAELLIKTLNEIELGNICRKKQNDEMATYAPMLNKDWAKINWNDSAEKYTI